MTAEPTAALSVRISAKTKRYLDALAEKKGIGVGKVLDQIVAELEQVPEETYYLRSMARMAYFTNFNLRTILNRSGLVKDMESQYETVRKHADMLFGPMLPVPEAFKNADTSGSPNEFKLLWDAFASVDPILVPKKAEAPPAAPDGATGNPG